MARRVDSSNFWGERRHFVMALWVLSLAFVFLWVVFSLLPRAHSQEAVSYFGDAYLAKTDGRASRGRLATGLNALVVFLTLYWLSRARFMAGWYGDGRPLTPGGAFLFGVLGGALVAILLAVASLPASFYAGHLLERQYGLSNASFGIWLADYAKETTMSALMYGAAGGSVAWALVKFPRNWPWLLTLGFTIASAFLTFIYPSVIAPLFDRFYPLEDQTLLADVNWLSEEAGMRIDKVLVMEASIKTSRVNAYFAGLGKSRQVVLYDTLLATHSRDQVKLVLAHEMGHWRHAHVSKGLLASMVGAMMVLFAFRWSMPGLARMCSTYAGLERALLLLLLVSTLAGYAASPLTNAISRRFEVVADRYSLQLTGDPGTFISTQVNLAKANLSDVEPPKFLRWFAWTHPTTMERIRFAQNWE